jgi:hypothetical protein
MTARKLFFSSALLISLYAMTLNAGCASRNFNKASGNNISSNKEDTGSSRASFELCGKVFESSKEGQIRNLRLNPKSSSALATRRNQTRVTRDVDIEFSSHAASESDGRVAKCYTVEDSGSKLVVLNSRKMTDEEIISSLERVACGKIQSDNNAFKVLPFMPNGNQGDVWFIGRDQDIDSGLRNFAGSQIVICALGKPIYFESGTALVVDSQSFWPVDGTENK